MGVIVKVGEKGYHVNYSTVQWNDQDYNSKDVLVFLRLEGNKLEIVAATKSFQKNFQEFMSKSSKLIGES